MGNAFSGIRPLHPPAAALIAKIAGAISNRARNGMENFRSALKKARNR
jgi:hypothetical protein